MKKRYVHTERGHNLKAPKEIVPIVFEMVKPKSVVDVGCGLATFLHCFREQGVDDILAIDGPWANKELLSKNISLENFMEANLEKPIRLDRKFDLAVCLEVVEHLEEKASDVIVESLAAMSDIILFSAAIPKQGGQNHINEQWPHYWEEKFNKHGYIFQDVLRQIFWHNDKIDLCYKQNCFLVTKNNITIDSKIIDKYKQQKAINFVHPDLFEKMYNRTPGGFIESILRHLKIKD